MNYEIINISINTAVRNKALFWKDHILQRMRQRSISVDDVLTVLENYNIIEEYSNDRPFPSFLLLGHVNEKPFHIVAAVNCEDVEIHLITVYIPDSSIWADDYRRRK